ncbi:MAG: hypothetical protein ACSW8F_02845, partial [bacterium]
MKKVWSMFLTVFLCLSFSANAFASAVNDNSDMAFLFPAAPASSDIISDGNDKPIGNLSEDELKALQGSLSNGCNACFPNRHFSLTPHFHQITAITSTYVGQRNRGVVAQTADRIPTTSQLRYEKTRSVSNSWSTTISFEKSIVTAEVGYNCEYSSQETASYVLDIPPNMLG